jgi:MraZ protein
MADVFRGSYQVRVDEKGRLKLPADYKRLVDEKCGPNARFFVTSLDGKRALLYPMKEWELKEERMAAAPASDPDVMLFQRNTASFGQEAEVDGQGRISIHPFLRNRANLGGDVQVLGFRGKLEPGFLQVTNFDQAMRELDEVQVTTERLAGMASQGL